MYKKKFFKKLYEVADGIIEIVEEETPCEMIIADFYLASLSDYLIGDEKEDERAFLFRST